MDFVADNQSGSADGSIRGAVERLNDLHSEQSGLPTEEAEAVEVEAAEPEEVEAQPEESEEVEGSEEDTPQAEAQPEGESSGDESEEPADEEKHLGYLRDKDYRQKTMALSEERRAINERAQELEAKLTEAAQLLDFEEFSIAQVNTDDLDEYDKSEVLEKKDALNKKLQRYQELQQERAYHGQLQYQQYIAEQAELLPQKIPEWLDQDVAMKELGDVRQHLVSEGFHEQEVGSMTDARALSLFRKAMLYDRMMLAKPEKKKAVKKKPKSIKPGVPKTSEQKMSDRQRAMRGKLKETGHVKDAQAAIKDLLTR